MTHVAAKIIGLATPMLSEIVDRAILKQKSLMLLQIMIPCNRMFMFFPWKEGADAYNEYMGRYSMNILCLRDLEPVLFMYTVNFLHFAFRFSSLTIFYIFKCTSTMYYITFLVHTSDHELYDEYNS